MPQIGYIRVSAVDQNTDRQLADIELDKVFEEKASAKDAKRPQLQECLDWLRHGDTLHVHSIDRLARNLVDLLAIIKTLTAKGVAVQFHQEGLAFTGDNNPMQQLQLSMLGAVAEFERSLIRERQREGIAAAKAQGRKLGAPAKLNPEQIEAIRAKLAAGASKKAIAQEYGISRTTLYSTAL